MSTIICKHCGDDSGFYVKERVTGTVAVYYTEEGKYHEDQTDMYEHLSHVGGKKAYCSSCHKYIGKSEDLIKS